MLRVIAHIDVEVIKNDDSDLDARIFNECRGRFAHYQDSRGSCLLEGRRRQSGLEGMMKQKEDTYLISKVHYIQI